MEKKIDNQKINYTSLNLSKTNLSDKNRKIITFISVFMSAILMISYLFIKKDNNFSVKNNNFSQNSKKISLFEDFSKYEKDSDKDGYPDFIEELVGLDKNYSETDRCQRNDCDFNFKINSKKKNILIILDASGSMELLVNGQTRMNLAKQAIKNYINQAVNINNFGLMIYGHKGSNSVNDKLISCNSAEMIASIGSVNQQNIDQILSQVKSTGWTPIGLAIKESKNAFTGKEGEENEIIIVTDGEESCDTNPVEEARNIKNLMNIKVNVIAFAVEPQATTSLIQIAQAGGGTFVSASNAEELDRRFNELYQKGLQAYEFTKCKSSELELINNCYQEAYNRVDKFIQEEKKKFFEKKISLKEYQILDDLSDKIFSQLINFKNDVSKKYQESTKEVHDKAFNQ